MYAFYHLMHLRFQTLSHLRSQYHLTDKRSSSLPAILCTCGHFDIIHNFNGVWLCPSTDNVPHIHWCASLCSPFIIIVFFWVLSASYPIAWYPSRVLFLFSMCYWIIFYTSASLGWYGWIFFVAFIPIYISFINDSIPSCYIHAADRFLHLPTFSEGRNPPYSMHIRCFYDFCVFVHAVFSSFDEGKWEYIKTPFSYRFLRCR